MPDFNTPASFGLPFSGNVTQAINPWTANLTGNQWSLFNVNLGKSSDTQIEHNSITDVASYGKQLGRVEELLVVLLKYAALPPDLPPDEARAVNDFKCMVRAIADIKQRHNAPHYLRP
jgi:hypothetical protein